MESIGNAAPDSAALPCAFGEYVLLREIGRGAMGIVYEARQERLGRTVALKMLAAGRLASGEDARRLLAEARAAAQLEHSGIVRVHDAGVCEGRPYFTMERVNGCSLAEEVAGGPLAPERAARLLAEAADAIQYAHERSVVHRDLKPRNILLDEHGRARITDFGLAKSLDADSSLTGTGEAIGTPAYMAPEQAVGDAKNVGPAADVYGLGAVLYTLLSGRPLFLSPTALGTLKQVQEREPIPLRVLSPSIPKDLETICHACLRKIPERRYASAAALAEDLRRFLGGLPIAARPVTRLERLVLHARRRPGMTALSLAVAVLTVPAVVAITWQWRRSAATVAELRRAERETLATRLAALTSANAESFAYLAEGLDAGDAAVASGLRRAFNDSASGARARLRARWALAPSDPALLDGALDALAEQGDDPRELELGVIALRRVEPRAPPAVWRDFLGELASTAAQDAGGERRILAAALLCSLDPSNEGWLAARDALALHLARADPYSLPAWEAALEPFPPPLLDALATIYTDGNDEERLACARILARQGRSAPELLLRLLPRSDDRQYVALLPAALAERELAAEALRALLAARSAPAWLDADADWEAPDAEAAHVLEDAGGLIAERYAFAPDLGADDFLFAADELRTSGYRPVRARPRLAEGELRLAAVWARDGGPWELAFDVTDAELASWERTIRSAGLAPTDLAAWISEDDGEARHVALAARSPADPSDAALLHGELDLARAFGRELLDANARFAQRGFRPDCLQIAPGAEGTTHACSVWLRMERVHEFFMPPAIRAEAYARGPFPLFCQMDVAVWRDPAVPAAPPAFAGVWYPDPERESRALLAGSSEQHRDACCALAVEGWRPKALGAEEGVVASVWQRPLAPLEERLAAARERALAAIALLHLGLEDEVWPLLADDGDRDLRSHLLVRMGTLGVAAGLPLRRLACERDASVRRALALALGSYAPEALSEEERAEAVGLLRRLFREDPDPGLHSACEWTLRTWGEALEPIPTAPEGARWQIAPSGLELIVIPGPAEFLMGAPGTEVEREPGETPHRRRIPRTYALSAKEISHAELAPFFEEVPALAPGFRAAPDAPIVALSWYQAAGFCRWLSEREGFAEEEMCYPPLGEIGPGMALLEDAPARTGYRLPTEAEWEHACRAGSSASYSFGSDPALLPAFAHCRANSLGEPGPTGRFRPNDFGFFDMHGNAMEWCHDPMAGYGIRADALPTDDVLFPEAVPDPEWKVIRGGTFDDLAAVLRCAQRKRYAADAFPRGLGFRVARTLR